MAFDFGSAEYWRWDGSRDCVYFFVRQGAGPIPCRLSLECIEDNMGNPLGAAATLAAAKDHFDQANQIVGQLIEDKRFEPDGSIMIRSEDWH